MRKQITLFLGAIVLPLIGMATASADEVNTTKLDQFKQNHPEAMFYGTQFYDNEGFFEDVGTSNMIYGTALSTGRTPLASAWSHVAELDGIFARDLGSLVPKEQFDGEVLQGVMWDKDAERHRFYTFRYQQMHQGLPVFRSGIGFLVRNEPAENYPVVMSGSNFKEMENIQLAIAGDEAVVTDAMKSSVNEMFDATKSMRSVLRKKDTNITVSDERLVIYAGVGNVPVEPELAVVFMAERGSIKFDYKKHLVVASVATGEVLHSETQIHELEDVSGSVAGRATQGLATLECDPEVSVPMPYATVQVVGGNSAFADANGNFTITNGSTGNVTVRSFLRGRYFEVFDDTAGGATPQIDLTVNTSDPADFTHNPNNNQQSPTANVNAYVEANRVRDFVLSYEPFYPTIWNQTGFDIVTNEDSFSGITACNAVYTGNSMVFWRNGGGCNNTSFSDVVHHEYGHHLINVTGNGQGQMGEGSGDAMGVLIQDDPVLGQGFTQSCSQGIRNANNNLQYPCTGAIHTCGQLMSGCVWSLRNELIVTEPSNYRDIGASLFIGMLIVRGQMEPGNQTIEPSIGIYYLELDDTDSNIGNGTPHYTEIANAFGSHNMDVPALQLLDFAFPDGRPASVDPSGGVAFNVEISPAAGSIQPGTATLHVNTGSGFVAYPMSEVGGNLYAANFPESECTSEVRYYFSVETTTSVSQLSPENAPTEYYTAISADSLTTTFDDNFQQNLGWSVSGNAGDGQWNRGVPQGGGDRGDPEFDGDGSGACYVTDNVAGNSDVDDGSTILTSPVMDASLPSVDSAAILTYTRWYSNTFGNAPNADTFVVEISNNGGSTWSNLETVGPSGAEADGGWFTKTFNVADFIAPTDQMRIRFTASDLGDGSVVEAGVDGVSISIVECGPPDPVVVTATSVAATRGTYAAGSAGSLSTSDNADFSIRRASADTVSRTEITATSASTTENPTLFTITVEDSVFARTDVNRIIELFNYDTSSWEGVDTQLATRFVDSTVTVDPTGDLSRFVESGTLEIRARIRYQWLNPRQVFTSNTDLFTWTIQ